MPVRSKDQYLLKLFVAGATERSNFALQRIRELCEAKLKGIYTLKVFDIFQQPEIAKEYQIVTTPTLIFDSRMSRRRFIGTLGIFTGLSDEIELLPDQKKR